MGMSLRIGMWSPISLTLEPRVGITLIAASHDSLNPQLSLWVFFFFDNYQADYKRYWDYKILSSTSIGPLKRICSSDSSEIHFNYLFMYISVTELDVYKFLTHCALSWKCQKGIWESEFLLYYPDFPFFVWLSEQIEVRKYGVDFKQTPPALTLNWAITNFHYTDSYDLLTIMLCCFCSFAYDWEKKSFTPVAKEIYQTISIVSERWPQAEKSWRAQNSRN